MDARYCRTHPDRPASGICVGCRASICPDCTTKIQGINHCVPCLARMASRSAQDPGGPSTLAGALRLFIALLVFWAFFGGLGGLLMLF